MSKNVSLNQLYDPQTIVMIKKHTERCHQCKGLMGQIESILTGKKIKFNKNLSTETIRKIHNNPTCLSLFAEITHHAVEEVKKFDKTLSYHKKT